MRVDRRRFLTGLTAATAGLSLGGCATRSSSEDWQVMTVQGPIRAAELGPTLPHEHVFLDFQGLTAEQPGAFADAAFTAALPHLRLLKDLGCHSLAECTPAYLGRDPVLLQRLAQASGLHLLTNTGYYGAGQNRHLPRHAWTATADELAGRWLAEWHDGIAGTGIRPGFIKIGVDSGTLSNVHRALVRAACRTHLASGLTIAAHTGDGAAAFDQLSVLREEGVAPSAFIWVHAQEEKDTAVHIRAVEAGAWVEFDHVSDETVGRHADLVKLMRNRGLLGRVLVSHDGGWYEAGKPDGGKFRPYDTVFKKLLPALKESGFSEDEIHQLLVRNPREAFAIRIRGQTAKA
jgi:phosphotriesterase-related protein